MADLLPTGRSGVPGVVVFLDCETRDTGKAPSHGAQEHRLWFGVARAGRMEGGRLGRMKELRFDKAVTFWTWLDLVRKAGAVTWLFAHNLPFDLAAVGFWRDLEKGEFLLRRERPGGTGRRSTRRGPDQEETIESGLILTEDPPSAVLCWHRSGWRLHCVDTMNYFPMSLARLGELVGLDKLPMPSQDAPRAVWDEYCRRDVEIIERAICQLSGWWGRSELGRWPLTISSGALSAWRERWLHIVPHIPDDPEQRRFERTACWSGRLESRWVGSIGPEAPRDHGPRVHQLTIEDGPPRGPYHLIDSTSFYGWLMASELVPVATVASWDEETGGELGCPELGADCLAAVRIVSSSERFPVRTPAGVAWATGSFDTVLAGSELARAVDSGSVGKVYRVIKYELAPLFQHVARGLWEELEQAEAVGLGAVRTAIKLMLARLPGKFAQRANRWVDRPELVSPVAFGAWVSCRLGDDVGRRFRSLGWLVQEQQEGPDPEHVWPALFAFITAAGRETLLAWMRAAGEANTLYLNTDGLIVTDKGREWLEDAGLIRPGELGGLRIVESSPSLEIRGPGSYRIASKNIHMGRTVGGVESAPGVWTAPAFPSMNQQLMAADKAAILIGTRTTAIPRRLPVGEVTSGGWVVAPSIVASTPGTPEPIPVPF